MNIIDQLAKMTQQQNGNGNHMSNGNQQQLLAQAAAAAAFMNQQQGGANPLNDIENLKDRNLLEKDLNQLKALQQAFSGLPGFPGANGMPPGMNGQQHSSTMAHLMAAAAMAQQGQNPGNNKQRGKFIFILNGSK